MPVKLKRIMRRHAVFIAIGSVNILGFLLTTYMSTYYPSLKKLEASKIEPIMPDQRQDGPTSAYKPDYMPEDVALRLDACVDHMLAANPSKSKLALLIASPHVYNLGDTIPVGIQLYDGYGKPLKKGGAILRARMFNKAKKAYATAYVTDNGDGSYTAEFEAIWVGKATITVKIAYVPEAIRANYFIRRTLPATREIEATFTADEHREATLCHPQPGWLKGYNYTAICNLTGANSGMPWFCGKPTNIHLLCEDWTEVNNHLPLRDLPVTPCEEYLMKNAGHDISESLNIFTADNTRDTSVIDIPAKPCRDFDRKSLWSRKQPTGFMYQNKWHLRHCKSHDPNGLFLCLKDKHILLTGDSTVRQWYKYVLVSLNCIQMTEVWTKPNWHQRSACVNHEYNFTVEWLPHSQPFFGSDQIRHTGTSIPQYLDEIGTSEPVIVLIHLYLHTVSFHHSVFQQNCKIIRRSIENLFKRNKFAKVLIKGPHTYYESNIGKQRLQDYYGLVYRHIMYNEFSSLHNKVIYLENSDITNALALIPNHPSDTVVGAMLSQMFDYIC